MTTKTMLGSSLITLLLLPLAACLGPVARPATAPVPTGARVRITPTGDTLRLHWTGTATGAPDADQACAAKQLEGVLESVSADTIRLRSVSFAIAARRVADPACQRRGGAIIVAPAASWRMETLEPVSLPVQVGGSLVMIGVVLGVSLLLFNAADGLLGIVGRWF